MLFPAMRRSGCGADPHRCRPGNGPCNVGRAVRQGAFGVIPPSRCQAKDSKTPGRVLKFIPRYRAWSEKETMLAAGWEKLGPLCHLAPSQVNEVFDNILLWFDILSTINTTLSPGSSHREFLATESVAWSRIPHFSLSRTDCQILFFVELGLYLYHNDDK